jgi:hypothetical protein
VIRINSNNTYTIGTPNADGTLTAVSSSDWRYTMFNSAISTLDSSGNRQAITDDREVANVKLATLDISKILTNSSTPTYKSSNFTNPIVYIYDAAYTSTSRRGIRLKNGNKIPALGLTVVSNNPIYIQGDLNTGGNPPSNSGAAADADTPQVAGYTRAPVAILGDAVNILSNSWSDSASGSMPDASNTTVNAAIISGIVPTAPVGGDGSYSGGAENFPRFLENWNGNTLTYYGSMVELYQSKQAIGEWGKAGVYSPPIRQWFFDNNFKTKPPPGSIMVYSYVKGKWSSL